MTKLNLSFIGAGNMANAIYQGVTSKGLYSHGEICMSNRGQEKLERYKALGTVTTCNNLEAVEHGDIIVLSIKPQMYEQVFSQIAPYVSGKCLVTIAPGYTTEYISKACPGSYVVRAMPNTPLLLGAGTTAVASNDKVPSELFQAVVNIFACAGTVHIMPEDKMNQVASINGSSPAYFFRIAQAMVSEAERMGFDPQQALKMVGETMSGSAKMLLESGKTAQELTAQVTSKGGSTLAALTAFDEMGLEPMISEAMARCTARCIELGH